MTENSPPDRLPAHTYLPGWANSIIATLVPGAVGGASNVLTGVCCVCSCWSQLCIVRLPLVDNKRTH